MCRQLRGPSASMQSASHVPSVPRCRRSGFSLILPSAMMNLRLTAHYLPSLYSFTNFVLITIVVKFTRSLITAHHFCLLVVFLPLTSLSSVVYEDKTDESNQNVAVRLVIIVSSFESTLLYFPLLPFSFLQSK